MRKIVPFVFIFLFILVSCTKDKDKFVTGRVEAKGGCFADSWLVSIDDPNPEKHSFLQVPSVLTATFYNSSNAVYIKLPASLAVSGRRIRFIHTGTEPFSCLSYSAAPNHIHVKSLSRK